MTGVLRDIYLDYYNEAASIDNFENIDKNDIVRLYVSHENDYLKDTYFAGTMIKYWFLIDMYYDKCKSLKLEKSDFCTLLGESILKATHYRKWEDKNNKLYNDKNAPYKVINRCFYSLTKLLYYNSNLDKNRINYGDHFSLDYSDSYSDIDSFYYSNEIYTTDSSFYSELNFESVLEYLAKKNRADEFIVLNILKDENVFFKNNKMNYTYVIKQLKNMPMSCVNDLSETYRFNKEILVSRLLYLQSLTMSQLNGIINKSIDYIVYKELF